MISILFLKARPSLLPKHTPAYDNRNVTVPITIIGVVISTSRKAKLSPTASASMLVAIDNINKAEMLNEFGSLMLGI